MFRPIHRWTHAVLLTALGTAAATPVLPAPALAAQAVRSALTPDAAAPRPAQKAAQPTPPTAARVVPATAARPQAAARPAPAPTARTAPRTQAAATQAAAARARAVQQAQAAAAARAPRTGRSAVVRATAYNSLAAQTDSTPFITATGTRTRPGVVALSRDLLRSFPYGSKIMIEDLSGQYNHLLRGRVFSVEDTMAARKTNSLDIWMGTRSQALQFGARQVRITAVR